jgi:DNA-binding CsgD family transcriptional regulator
MRLTVAGSQAPVPALVGREADVSALRAFIAAARRVGGALVVTGDPGLGKSTLVDVATAQARASGVRVAAIAGSDGGANQPFAALGRLGALLSESGVLPADQEKSLVTPIGTPAGSPPLAVFTAVLCAIRQASLAGPLLITVDDAQWLDGPSAEALAFVARRLRGSRVGVLVASRPGDGPLSARGCLPTRHLTRLTDEAATYLLVSRFPDLPSGDRERLISEAEGIPLALVELAAALVGEQRTVSEALPAVLPMSARFQALFDSRIAGVPDLTHVAVRGLRRRDALGADPSGSHSALLNLFADAMRADPAAGDLLRARTVDACRAFGHGDLVAAYWTITDALKRFGSAADNQGLGWPLDVLQSVCHIAGSDEMWWGFRQTVAELGHRVPPALRLLAEISVRRPAPSRKLLAELDSAVDQLSAEDDARVILQVAIAAVAVDRGTSCHFAVRRVLEDASSGTVWSGMVALWLLAEIGSAADDTARVRSLAFAALGARRSTDHVPHAMLLRSMLALSTAVVGDHATVHALTQQALRWAEPARAYTVLRMAHWALARQALSKPDHAAAHRHFVAMAGDDGVESLVDRQPAVLFDLVEATVGSERRDVAHACVARARTGVSGRWDLIARGAQALVDERDPVAAFERAGTLHGADRWPFDLARIRLAYGEHLRRSGALDAARQQLNSALDTFRALGARPWITRAARHLRVAGAPVVGIGMPSEPLTRQEERIAALAASGLTNRDIARRIQLSERTIASHLRQVFRKTGITSRAQLRDALTARHGQG